MTREYHATFEFVSGAALTKPAFVRPTFVRGAPDDYEADIPKLFNQEKARIKE